jgi:hypothetical protein
MLIRLLDMNRESVVFISPLETGDVIMRFRLTYDGDLRPTQRDAHESNKYPEPLSAHKLLIRRRFHAQLKHLWATNRFLRDHKVNPESRNPYSQGYHAGSSLWSTRNGGEPMWQAISRNYHRDGFCYVPLVREEFSLLCSLNVIVLRRDAPGSVVSAGDLDNRIKTIIDCLRIPRSKNELPTGASPSSDEDPFFVLMEDDNQVTGLTVETDVLLDPPTDDDRSMKTRLMITVELRPYEANPFNINFS